ncbi:TauD/TfdA family dioxygenase [Promicromonospora sp. MS192]|uniref:TauD/TfdA family dioxygenase n=1 Tax=Promicromonospora sp. MS192 TaxID=3412684 RepID=UPI003C306738
MRDLSGRVQNRGIVVLPQLTPAEFRAAMAELGPIYHHPDGDAVGRTLISPSGRRGEPGPGFTMQALPLHTDRSSLPDPPRYLGMHLVGYDADMGGAPLFADLDLATTGLPPDSLLSLSIESTTGGRRLPLRLAGPSGLRYRDDAHYRLSGPAALVAEIRRRMQQVTQVVDWLRCGDAYIIDNHRIAHGRTQIVSPDRIGIRILAYSPEQTGAMNS